MWVCVSLVMDENCLCLHRAGLEMQCGRVQCSFLVWNLCVCVCFKWTTVIVVTGNVEGFNVSFMCVASHCFYASYWWQQSCLLSAITTDELKKWNTFGFKVSQLVFLWLLCLYYHVGRNIFLLDSKSKRVRVPGSRPADWFSCGCCCCRGDLRPD